MVTLDRKEGGFQEHTLGKQEEVQEGTVTFTTATVLKSLAPGSNVWTPVDV